MRKRLHICVKEGLAALFLFMANGLCWWYFRSYLNFLIGILMVLAIVLSAMLLWRNLEKLRVEAVLPGSTVSKNMAIPLAVRVENQGRWMFPIRVKYALRNDFTGVEKECTYMGAAEPSHGELHGRRRRGNRYRETGVHDMLEMLHYGYLSVRLSEVRVYDFLHLFYLGECAAKDAWTIATPANRPQEEKVRQRIVRLLPDETLRKSVDFSADYEIREYRPMDDMRDIHWKLTAKQRKLMVRERLSEGKPAVNVLLALTDEATENDARMEVLDGLCRRLLEQKYPVKLYWNKAEYQLAFADISYPEELDAAVCEILSGRGKSGIVDVLELFSEEHPGEAVIRVGEDVPILSED